MELFLQLFLTLKLFFQIIPNFRNFSLNLSYSLFLILKFLLKFRIISRNYILLQVVNHSINHQATYERIRYVRLLSIILNSIALRYQYLNREKYRKRKMELYNESKFQSVTVKIFSHEFPRWMSATLLPSSITKKKKQKKKTQNQGVEKKRGKRGTSGGTWRTRGRKGIVESERPYESERSRRKRI